MNQEEWLLNFKKEHGRNPSMEEFQAAKARNFVDDKAKIVQQELKTWVQAFEQQYGRKPSFEEVQQRKNSYQKGDQQPNQMKALFLAFEQQYGYQPSLDELLTYKDRLAHPEKYVQAQKQPAQVSVGRADTRVKRHSNKLKIIISLAVGLLVVLIALLVYGQHYYSYDATLARDANVLKSADSKKYAKISKWKDSNKSLSDSDLEAMAAYMKNEKMSSAELKQWIKRPGKGVSFERDGKAWLIFPRYVLKYEPVDLEVSTNQNGLSISMNDREINNDSSADDNLVVKHKAPGLYNFVAKGTVDGKKVRATDSAYFGGSENGLISLNVDKDSSDDKGKNNLSDDDASDLLSHMADSLSDFADSEGDFKDADDIFSGGSDNKTCKGFRDMISHNLHTAKRTADSIHFGDVNVTQVDMKSKNKADVKFEMTEDFNYSADTDPDGNTSGTKTQRYLLIAHLVYDKDKKKWLIDSIDPKQKKLSDDDNVN
ncbi:hypothetical protein [Eupransor demetentiae]|uniref:Contains N-terminal Zn ribbon domain (YvbJ) n=1 Tax=Eupransor demetentiae TaxID=3109584 RepID=A0ABP0EQF8_9LACO|nr:Uncharacterized protein YvbJ [Lactobacillaceae bacterium LMG 33000]